MGEDEATSGYTPERGESEPLTHITAPARTAVLPVVIAVVLIFATLTVVLVHTGVFDDNTSASDSQIVAAMLALLGGLVASAFTLVGVLLKHSIDLNTARRAEETERQRRREARDTEYRLRQETALKAVELLTTAEGKDAPAARQAGALFALAGPPLQQLDLALALLRQNWTQDGAISASAAVWVIDQALRQKDHDADAAGVLRDRYQLLLQPNGQWEFPRLATFAWPKSASYFARDALLDTLAELLAARSLATYDDMKPGEDQWPTTTTNSFIWQFDIIRRNETAPELRNYAVAILDLLLEWSLSQDPDLKLYISGAAPLILKELRAELTPDVVAEAKAGVTQSAEEILQKLQSDWFPDEPGDGASEPVMLDAEMPDD